MKISCPILRAA